MTKEQIQEFTLRTSQENHSGLMLILCDMEKVYLSDAGSDFAAGDIESAVKNTEYARRVINELISCFSSADPNGRTQIAMLRRAYGYLVRSVIKREETSFDKCEQIIASVREVIMKLHNLDIEGPVMKNAHRVYAGLTYGRGYLKESSMGADYSRRGFRA